MGEAEYGVALLGLKCGVLKGMGLWYDGGGNWKFSKPPNDSELRDGGESSFMVAIGRMTMIRSGTEASFEVRSSKKSSSFTWSNTLGRIKIQQLFVFFNDTWKIHLIEFELPERHWSE